MNQKAPNWLIHAELAGITGANQVYLYELRFCKKHKKIDQNSYEYFRYALLKTGKAIRDLMRKMDKWA